MHACNVCPCAFLERKSVGGYAPVLPSVHACCVCPCVFEECESVGGYALFCLQCMHVLCVPVYLKSVRV